jgi:hypothetical protein
MKINAIGGVFGIQADDETWNAGPLDVFDG